MASFDLAWLLILVFCHCVARCHLSDSEEEKEDKEEEDKKKEAKKTQNKSKKGAKNDDSIASLNSNYKEPSSDSDSLDMGKVRCSLNSFV